MKFNDNNTVDLAGPIKITKFNGQIELLDEHVDLIIDALAFYRVYGTRKEDVIRNCMVIFYAFQNCRED